MRVLQLRLFYWMVQNLERYTLLGTIDINSALEYCFPLKCITVSVHLASIIILETGKHAKLSTVLLYHAPGEQSRKYGSSPVEKLKTIVSGTGSPIARKLLNVLFWELSWLERPIHQRARSSHKAYMRSAQISHPGLHWQVYHKRPPCARSQYVQCALPLKYLYGNLAFLVNETSDRTWHIL